MQKQTLAAGFAAVILGSVVVGSNQTTKAQSPCRLASRNYPETFVEIDDARDVLYYKGTLFHQGKPIRRLHFTQSNGYGSKWWGYETDSKQHERRGGGMLLEFRGNHPARSLRRPVAWNAARQNLRQFILVGLGGDLYYSQVETEDGYRFPWREDGFTLIKAAEGYFSAEDGCEDFLPR